MVKVTAKQAFAHDGHRPEKGDVIEVNETLADELERAGLVEIKQSTEPNNKKMPEPKNK